MEKVDSFSSTDPHLPLGTPSNDNTLAPASARQPTFPTDAVARIYKLSRSATTSAKGHSQGWRLVFERRSTPVIEPLMGYTGGGDTLTQVALSFPTLEAALRYAERQGLTFVVQHPAGSQQADKTAGANETAKGARARKVFSDATLDRLGLSAIQGSYGQALDGAAGRNDPSGPKNWSTPMGVVRDPALTLEAKRSILMNWAWTEYLMDQATTEGMPESRWPSRLGEVEAALLALERDVAAGQDALADREAA
ncbi:MULTISPECIES: NADH dehydrogenase ubiquinone Fe-S protein 4 [Devosia]|uniref:NADH dehydrogenase ubiquinone Fe-S protein 4 n=1 Tax=Devosia TaxID=46913 RepID=UPI000CE94306|nr:MULTISPECIES: NADH dehydrogenase ubiquinone Fe-S protein 4 [Devosia]AVF05761.1 ETC complex I subunit [Devosia sp. I507]